MEPRIEYATTSDGVNIAYWVLGEGSPLVQMPAFPLSHVHLEWQIPECRAWFEGLCSRLRLVRYDARGSGLSQREASDFSLDAQIRDLDAVAGRAGLQNFAIFAAGDAAMAAIAYAAANPDRVSHLILWCAWARRADVSSVPQTETLRALLEQDWEIYTETVARVLLGWASGDAAQRFAAFFRESVTRDVLRKAIEAVYDVDVTDDLGKVACPTLILQPRKMTNPSVDLATRLAGRIENARVALLEGASPLWFADDMDSVLEAIGDFLGEDLMLSRGVPAESRGSRTVLFTDIEGSTALTRRLGDDAARQLLREHEQIVRDALSSHGGSEIKAMGDGFLASFSSATKAVECAIVIQRAFEERNQSAAEPLKIRVGLTAGEPIAEDRDLFGTAVNEAARITSAADGGEILVANVVRELTKGKGFLFSDRGEVVLRGFEDPVRLFEVGWRTRQA
jgi:class 3 adenylate cyclase